MEYIFFHPIYSIPRDTSFPQLTSSLQPHPFPEHTFSLRNVFSLTPSPLGHMGKSTLGCHNFSRL
jgi:hypothetical protein